VLKLLFSSGDDVPVLEPIAIIGASGEDWQGILGTRNQGSGIRDSDLKSQSETRTQYHNSNDSPQSSVPDPQSLNFISPRARKLAKKEALLLPVPGTGPGGRIIERDVVAALQKRAPLTSAAKAAGLASVPSVGSGLGGRITMEDLASFEQRPVPYPQSPIPDSAFTETPIKGVRKIIADRMLRSLAESAQLTLNASAPVTKLQEVRAGLKAQGITINDLILYVVSRTLKRHPNMNAHKIGESIRIFERVHLGVAVDTERGLLVPVIRNADMLSLAQISSEVKRLATACQAGSINPDELTGSTFTVTNLGSFGISSFTPILNIPEAAILGVCGIELKPISPPVPEATVSPPQSPVPIVFEPHIGFSLTINHQIVDGAPAARFLKDLGETIASIDSFL
jgi:pyruvate dehydrogenase E2 component (dihydrolipoamide acetyltransferase)